MQETEIIKENRCEYNNNNLELWWNQKEDKKRGAVCSAAPHFLSLHHIHFIIETQLRNGLSMQFLNLYTANAYV